MSETTAPAVTLVEFLEARLDEAEQVARDAAGWSASGRERAPGAWQRDGINSVVASGGRCVIYGDGPAPADTEVDHIVRQDPAHVLTDIQVKRRIIADEAGYLTLSHPTTTTLRLLALPFAGHPDYNPDWRPHE